MGRIIRSILCVLTATLLLGAVTAFAESSEKWTFNTDGDTEGWTFASAAANAGRTSQSDGKIRYTTPSGAYSWKDNYITYKKSDFSINADSYVAIEIDMKHDFKDTGVNLNKYGYSQVFYGGKKSDGSALSVSETHSVKVKLDDNSGSKTVTHRFELSNAPDWSGSTITEFMIKPLLDDGNWEIDEIRLIPAENLPFDATDVSLEYIFEDTKAGTADGTIKMNFGDKNTANISDITLNWSKRQADGTYTALDDYLPLKKTTVSEMKSGYTFDKDLLIPSGADSFTAYIKLGTQTYPVSFDIPSYKLTPERGEPLYTFAIISDIHVGGFGSKTEPSARLVSTRNQINSLADFVVINGDLTQWYGAYSEEAFYNYHDKNNGYNSNGNTSTDDSLLISGVSQWDVLDGYLKGFAVPVYAVQGNHDVNDSTKWNTVCCNDKYWNKFLNDWIDYSNKAENGLKYQNAVEKQDGVNYYCTEINGYSFIFLEIPRSTSPYYSFGDEQLKWLDEKLFEKEQSGKPIFVFGHVPLETQLSGGYWDAQLLSSGADEALKSILAKHPNAIYTSGHTHFALDTNYKNSIDGKQNTYSLINSGGIATVQTPNSETSSPEDSTELSTSSQGVIAEVYEDCLVIRSRDFTQNKWISRGHTVITFKNASEVATPELYGVRDDGDNAVTIIAVSDGTEAYEWYIDGVKQSVTADRITVSSDFAGFIAVRAFNENGDYASCVCSNTETLTDVSKLAYLIKSVELYDSNASEPSRKFTAKVTLSKIYENTADDGYVLLVGYDLDGRVAYGKLKKLSADSDEYTFEITSEEKNTKQVAVYVLDGKLRPRSIPKTLSTSKHS